MVKVSTNGPGDQSSIPGRVIWNTKKKWYLIPHCLTFGIIRYGSRVKWSNPGNGITPCPSAQCSSYWKGSRQVTLDYTRQLYLYTHTHTHTHTHTYIYIYIKIKDKFEKIFEKYISLRGPTYFFRLMKTVFIYCRPSTSWPVVYKSQER